MDTPERSLGTCEFGRRSFDRCRQGATRTMSLHPFDWHRGTCTTHQLDFQAGAVRMAEPELIEAWDRGTLRVNRPVCQAAAL